MHGLLKGPCSYPLEETSADLVAAVQMLVPDVILSDHLHRYNM